MIWWLWAQQFNPFCAPAEDVKATPLVATATTKYMSTLAEHGTQACCVWSEEDGFHHFSENWARVTGLPPSECYGPEWMEYFHPDAQDEFIITVADMFSQDFYDHADAMRMECQIMRGAGSWGWLQMTLVPMSMVGGKRSISVLVSDITVEKDAQQQAEEATRKSEIVQHGRSAFLSNISHELRTPLNAVLGFAQLLESNVPGNEEHAKEYLRYIRESGENLLVKINDLIEIANIDAYRARTVEEPLNLRELIDASIELHSHTAFERDIRIRTELDRPNIVVQADRRKLVHIIGNLLLNAIEHSHRGGEVIISSLADPRAGLTLTVSDKGTGIPRDHLSHIHEMLNSCNSYYSVDIGNVGIGLAIAKELTELHHGQLSINSTPGEGTIAKVQLPAGRIISLSARVKLKRSRIMA